MDKTGAIRSENFAKKGAGSARRNVIIFMFFLLLSFIFWYLNSLGKNIETDIRYPVRFINIPKNKIIAEEKPARLNLFFSGPGYSILRLKISANSAPFVIDFSKVPYKPLHDNKQSDYYIVTSGLIQNFNSQLKSVCKITSVKPDTLFFTLN